VQPRTAPGGPFEARVTSPAALETVTQPLNAWIQVDLDRLARNVAALRTTFGTATETIALVKANAYGAGIEGIAPALAAAGVQRFAVMWVEEGLVLRKLLPEATILVLGHTHPAKAGAAVAAGLTVTVDSHDLGHALSCAALAAGAGAPVHIHIDSGLHREGLDPEEAVALATALRAMPGLRVEGLSTHMANADEGDDGYSGVQAAVFARVCAALPWVPYRHAANSATALRRAGLRFDGVRIGLALHGVLPENTESAGLAPILSLRARLARVSRLAPGEGVGYGLTWRAGEPATIGLVPVGYADGWKRALSPGGHVLHRGRRVPIVGRIMMDHVVIDLTGAASASAGDEVVLLGAQGSEEIPAWEVAARAGTIAWDITASLTSRLPRVYHRDALVERTVWGSHAT
jgi:alanine racemase